MTGTTNTLNLGFPVSVALGGTGIATTTAYSVICAGTTSTGAFQSLSSVGSSGQVLTSNGASALPTWQAAPAGFSTVNETGSSVTMTANVQYVNTGTDNAQCTYTIPATAAQGASFRIMGVAGNTGGWILQANTGQTVYVGATATSSAGSVTPQLATDGITIVCTVADTDFVTVEAVGQAFVLA